MKKRIIILEDTKRELMEEIKKFKRLGYKVVRGTRSVVNTKKSLGIPTHIHSVELEK